MFGEHGHDNEAVFVGQLTVSDTTGPTISCIKSGCRIEEGGVRQV
jgi:hypothetical protein